MADSVCSSDISDQPKSPRSSKRLKLANQDRPGSSNQNEKRYKTRSVIREERLKAEIVRAKSAKSRLDPDPAHPDLPCLLDQLNDDVILIIFRLLNNHDRLRLEIVCKRWSSLLRRSWNSIHKLSLAKTERETAGYLVRQNSIQKLLALYQRKGDARFGAIIRRCGAHLESLEISPTCILSRVVQCNLRLVATQCSALTSLKLHDISISVKAVLGLSAIAPHLEEVILRRCEFNNKRDESVCITSGVGLKQLFTTANFAKLKLLDLLGSNLVNFEFLAHLPASICRLNLNDLNPPTTRLKDFVQTHPQLEELHIRSTISSPPSGLIAELVHSCPGIRVLDIGSYRDNFGPIYFSGGIADLKRLAELSQLRELSLCRLKMVIDDVMKMIALGCQQLQVLRIGQCFVTGAGLRSLNRLRHLRILDISHLREITDETIGILTAEMAELRVLIMRGLRDVTDVGLVTIGTNCPRIECLDISKCRNITKFGIENFLRAIVRHEHFKADNRKLQIYTYCPRWPNQTQLLRPTVPPEWENRVDVSAVRRRVHFASSMIFSTANQWEDKSEGDWNENECSDSESQVSSGEELTSSFDADDDSGSLSGHSVDEDSDVVRYRILNSLRRLNDYSSDDQQ